MTTRKYKELVEQRTRQTLEKWWESRRSEKGTFTVFCIT